MFFQYDGNDYEILVEKKRGTKNTYIRVKQDLKIYITTNIFTSDKMIVKLVEENKKSISRMIDNQLKKIESNDGFYYLGKKYEIVYVEYCDISFGEQKVFLNKNLDIDSWYKRKAKNVFKERLDVIYNRFSKNIPYPALRIRKMTTRWGVCNTKSKTVTLNLELMKRDLKYLDYVIVHELSHLIHPNHSKNFWELVEENCPSYKQIKKEMKDF